MAKPRKRKTTAPGQAYGYIVQVVRVMWHLLRASPGDIVAFETLGDVSVESGGTVVSEEDKSGLAHNPIADGSSALWKTLANWADARRNGDLPAASKYILYVAQQHEGQIVQRLSDCNSPAVAMELVQELRKRLAPADAEEGDAEDKASLKAQLRRLFSHSDGAIAAIVLDFALEIATASPFDEVRAEIARSTSDDSVDLVTEQLLGWVKRQLMKHIEARTPVRVSYDDFRKQRLAVLRRVDRNLTSFPECEAEPTRAEIEAQLVGRRYVHQLNLLNLDDDDLEQHISDYLRASTARTEWSASGYLDREGLRKYKKELEDHWRLCRMAVKSSDTATTPINRGVQLLFQCMAKDPAEIQSLKVPQYFSRGSYHAMADEPRIGWHPEWKKLLNVEAKRGDDDAD